MTQLLEEAFSKVADLTDSDQDAIAVLILEELADEARWERAFEKSSSVLERLARQALAEHKAGNTRILDVNDL